MRDFVDATAFNCEQGNRARKLFAAVVLAALDDAIADDKKYEMGQSRSPVGHVQETVAKFCPARASTQMNAL